jgi:hypothetical protein
LKDETIPARLSEASQRRIAGLKKKRSERFVKGPIPLPWLAKAATLPGKTLAVGLLLWFQGGITGYDQVQLGGSNLKRFGIERKAASAALRRLEGRGLVRVARAPGKRPIVGIVRTQENLETGE